MKKTNSSLENRDLIRSFIARQPIFDRNVNVISYELLFRGGQTNSAKFPDGTEATAQVMKNGLMLFGLNSLTQGKKALINVDREILAQGFIKLFPPDLVIPEVLETVPPEPDVLEACRTLREMGYTVALDDVVDFERVIPFADAIDIVKVDFMDTDPDTQKNLAEKVTGMGLQALAEKVESHEEFSRARIQGYTYFQGYFFSKPEVLSKSELPPNKMQYMQLMRELHRTDLDMDRLEKVLKTDVSLSYRLLRFINSAQFALRSKVNSLNHALRLLGPENVRKWATLVTMASIGDDKPLELVVVGLTRAYFCESLGQTMGLADYGDDLFLTGMFSVLDALADQPLDQIIRELSLAQNITEALLERKGVFGDILNLSFSYERGRWEEVERKAEQLNIETPVIIDTYLNAAGWALENSPGSS